MTVEAEPLSAEEREKAREVFEGKAVNYTTGVVQRACVHCAGVHDVVDDLPRYRQPCRRVKRAVWSGDDLVEVEYWADGRWDQADVIFPADAYETDDDETPEDTA